MCAWLLADRSCGCCGLGIEEDSMLELHGGMATAEVDVVWDGPKAVCSERNQAGQVKPKWVQAAGFPGLYMKRAPW